MKDSEALSSGVALFYEVLKFITSETKQFPPSCQYLTSCIEILGQEFIQRDPNQTNNILQLLLTQQSLGGLLAPLFDPNVSPNQFVSMYSRVCEVSIKEGPNVAFSVLTKFNIVQWIGEYNPSVSECTQLLEYIFQGITYCGRDPPDNILVLLEGYLAHLGKLIDYQFPLLFNKTLHLIIDGTDTAGITPRCWEELSRVTTPTDSTHTDTCRLGLQVLQECIQYLTEFYNRKRLYTKEPLYVLISTDFISVITQFMYMLSTSLITKCCTSVELGNNTEHEALKQCWFTVVDLFRALLFPLHTGEGNEILYPCQLESTVDFAHNVKVFTDIIHLIQNKFNADDCSVLDLLWSFYCNELALPDCPDYILQSYHGHFTSLPWQQYMPYLPAMDLMMKLKIDTNISRSCFVFLGDIFPLFNWKSVADHYCTSSDSALPVQFHVTFLQLMIMLAAEPQVMNKKESRVPGLLSETKSFAFHYIDAKTFNDILEWQRTNCQSVTVLQSGSALSSALRLLKVAASFPINRDSKPLLLHKEGWDKRYSFIRLVVELIALTSQHKETHTTSYSDIISFLIQTVIDVVVYEPEVSTTLSAVYLLQEIFNLFNTCYPSESFVSSLLSHVTACLDQLPNADRLYLPTITAASRILVSIPIMVKLIEETIRIYFTHIKASLKEDTGYGWGTLSTCLSIPDTAHDEFCTVCVQEFACLCLNTYLRQQLPHCTSISQEMDYVVKIVQWASSLKPKSNEEYKVLLIWDKALNLLIRQLKFGGNIQAVINQFTTIANLLQRLGEDKATEGLLGAIGLGKKSLFSFEFRLISRVLSTYIHCQMPLDNTQSVSLRIVPNSPGHVKDPSRQQPGNTPIAIATKQADQACAGLESLLSNKSYVNLRDYIAYCIGMINDPTCTVMNITELFVYLLINLYPTVKCLDSIRVLQA